MLKLKKIILGIFASALILSTSALADSSNFAGPYIGVQGTALGVEMDASHKAAADDVSNTTTGQGGKFALIAGGELGYALPMSDTMLIDIGVNYVSGTAKLSSKSDDSTADNNTAVELSVTDLMTAYIAPTFALSDTSSIYVKFGYAEAETSVKGDVTKPSDLEGEVYAIGTRTQLDSGLYIRTEAGMAEYDKLTITGKGTDIATTTTVTADPTIAYGSVSIGMKF